ncbi:molybdopterin molybdotransferase MoeA [Bacillus sp. DNRA2]|uniref:molybdopterin molybdotransferase MoeA n=1 Tax=Bacillus sp. DNRA2 TaxID=2723053 RepID=UPI00145F6938|nr:gephyrin-like molybdotransferase Glp [Bacillus sp. DNRA2]NMD72411.1 molybdopterin molybdotransferase MoeA [Bacillus sp. DNRA2]
MLEVRHPIQIIEAVKRVMVHQLGGKEEMIPIDECDYRYLAEDIIATHDVPMFTRSGYDGFALRAEDTEIASSITPIKLKVVEEIAAGMVPRKELGPFEVSRIMTGAKIPKGANAVIAIELVKEFTNEGEKYISIKRQVKMGEHLSYQAEETRSGEIVIKKGTRINPGVKAVLATFGYSQVPVAVKPKIGIFATGSELLDVSESLQDGKIRNSNSYMIDAQAKRIGAEPIFFGKLPDEIEPCYEAISLALNKVDILITTGGVSVGDYDLMPEIYKRLNGNVLFNKVAMRPGSVTTVTALEGKLLFGLSGNPSASYVGFELFVRPIIRKMLYSDHPYLKFETVSLACDFPKVNPFTRFVRSKLFFENGEMIARPVGMDKSNAVLSLAKTDTLMVLPGSTRHFQNGDKVTALLLEDEEGSQTLWQDSNRKE